MGNTNSRRVTIVNDDTVGIVQVSDSVVKRLRENHDKENERPKTKEPDIQKPQQIIDEPKVSRVVPSSDTYVSTLEQRQRFNEEFKRAKASWQGRINDLEKQNKNLLDAAEDKLAAEVVKVETNYMKQTFEPVCPDKQEKVLKCYQENLKKPLLCSKEVKAFSQCLDDMRKTIIISQS